MPIPVILFWPTTFPDISSTVIPVPLLVTIIPLSKPLIMPLDCLTNRSVAVSPLTANILEP